MEIRDYREEWRSEEVAPEHPQGHSSAFKPKHGALIRTPSSSKSSLLRVQRPATFQLPRVQPPFYSSAQQPTTTPTFTPSRTPPCTHLSSDYGREPGCVVLNIYTLRLPSLVISRTVVVKNYVPPYLSAFASSLVSVHHTSVIN